MAAPAQRLTQADASLRSATIARRNSHDPACLIRSSRSGCWCRKVPAPRRAKPSRFSAWPAITSRSAIPRPGACRGFSNFVRKFHRCPGLRRDPAGYLGFVERLISGGGFDVLLPTHEQGFLFARMASRLQGRIGLALPGFDAYRTAHSKAGVQPAARFDSICRSRRRGS